MEESWLHPTSIALYFWVYMMLAGTVYQYRFYKYLELNGANLSKIIECF